MTLHATAQFFANGSRAFFHRRHIHYKSVKFYLAGLGLAFAFFCFVTFVPNKIVVFALLGAGPFLPLLLPKKAKFDFTVPGQAFLCGMIVTCFQLTGGVAGPALDMFFQKIPMTRHQVVATKAFTQTISHATKFAYFSLIVSVVTGAQNLLPAWIYLAVIPVAALGTHIGRFALDRLSDVHFYKATQIVLWSIGIVYLAKATALLLDRIQVSL